MDTAKHLRADHSSAWAKDSPGTPGKSVSYMMVFADVTE